MLCIYFCGRTVGKMFLSAPPDEIKGFLNEACEKDAAKVSRQGTYCAYVLVL